MYRATVDSGRRKVLSTKIPCVVFRQCPLLMTALADLFHTYWKQGQVPLEWKHGVIRLNPKAAAREDPGNPSNFQLTALTSFIGKLFTIHAA